jgi:uncharacterized protein (TIGR00369 family)
MTGRSYGTVSPEVRKEMTGLEFVHGLANRTLPLNTIARTLGYDVTAAEAGRVLVMITPTGDHLNPAGTVHGGLTATLLDSCMGLAVQSTLEKSEAQTTLEFKISLIRPITPETGNIGQKALSSIVAAASARPRGASQMARGDCSPMVPRPV